MFWSGVGCVVDGGGDVEEVKNLVVQWGEFWLEGLDDVVVGS